MSTPTLMHGGVGGIWPPRIIRPDMAGHRFVAGCPDCEAHKLGLSRVDGDPATPHGWVYATTDREYARYYASRAVRGWLYEVEVRGEVEPSVEDPPQFPTWRARELVVRRVLEKNVQLTMDERLALFVRWGGTAEEFETMIRQVTVRGVLRSARAGI